MEKGNANSSITTPDPSQLAISSIASHPSLVARRTRLRSRVFAITACYALTLFAIAFVLTWRARDSQRRADHLVSVDLRNTTILGDLVRNQNAFHRRWKETARSNPEDLPRLSTRYSVVSQLFEETALEWGERASLRREIQEYSRQQRGYAPHWSGLDQDQRRLAIATLDQLSRSLVVDAETQISIHLGETERSLPEMEKQARDMMWIALAIAWMVTIASFAVARQTLAKVVKPLEELSKAAESIAAGDLTARAPISGDREIAQLGWSFNHMAEALAESYAELGKRARTDELTGLPNFRSYREAIDAEIDRSTRYARRFGILVLDLDHFKQYNDRFGHHAGNEALEAVSTAIQSCLRTVDSPARYGGEEFAAILPEIDVTAMNVIAERIRVAVQDLPVPEGRAPITISIGGAIFPQDGASAESLFASADARLYEAKKRGRNVVVIPSEDINIALRSGG